MTVAVATICAVIWAYLLAGRGRFWLGPVRDGGHPPAPAPWPSVTVVIPARNEAEVIAAGLRSLLTQDYPGRLGLIVVDDNSTDATAAAAQAASDRISVIRGRPLPPGWTGKLWALHQGIAAAEHDGAPDYLLLTDADIVHARDTVSWLVSHAAGGGLVLTSLMAKLRCVSLAERALVPAFVYFFQLVYPFAWVRRGDTAAAAGGCVLVSANALRRAGGIDSIRDALIDDCALAAKLKAVGPIWLGLTQRVESLRRYERFADVEAMISRSAYTQLRHSPLLLAVTMLGLALTFLAPPLLVLFARGVPQWLGLAAWLAMAVSLQPTLRLYRSSPLWGLALPGIAVFYAWCTPHSAYQHLRKRGGQWKGRVYAGAPSLR